MGHPLRWYEPGAVYEITSRTIREQYLLRPCDETRDLILGVIGRAQHLYPAVDLHYFVYMSNHSHFLVSSTDGESIPAFMGFVNSNVAREIGRFRGGGGRIWGRRMRPIRVLDEASMVGRLEYLLSQGCKEGLVATPGEWPGASAYAAFVGEQALVGTWHARDGARRARKAKAAFDPARYRVPYPITLSPIPPWAHLGDEALRARHRALVADVTAATERANRALSRSPIGVAAVLSMDPWSVPKEVDHSPAPFCHAAVERRRAEYRADYRAFTEAFRDAGETLRESGAAVFPMGAFPCRGRFVAWPEALTKRRGGARRTAPEGMGLGRSGDHGAPPSSGLDSRTGAPSHDIG